MLGQVYELCFVIPIYILNKTHKYVTNSKSTLTIFIRGTSLFLEGPPIRMEEKLSSFRCKRIYLDSLYFFLMLPLMLRNALILRFVFISFTTYPS